MPSSERKWKSGDLVQLRKDVHGAGDIGVVIGPSCSSELGSLSCATPRFRHSCIDVLYHDGIRMTHPSNLQRPRKGGAK